MADYQLTQTGDQVQDILNNAAYDSDVQTVANDLSTETINRQNADTTLQQNIDAEVTNRQNAVSAEATARENAVAAEAQRAQGAESTLQGNIDTINGKIPSEASSENQLADKQFVNDSIATATATFRGTYNQVSDLGLAVTATHEQIAVALASVIAERDNNDYCFIQVPAASDTPTVIARIDRYKFDGTSWAFEYSLNNSGFTAAQWNAINSGITSGLVTKLNDLPTNAELTTLLNGKQDTISDLSTIRSGAAAGATAYQKPVNGIPATDMTSGVQQSLQKAEEAAPQATTYTKTEVNNAIATETTRAQGAEGTLQDNIDAEETRAKAAEQQNADDIDAIEAVIPSAASSSNQLADKEFVNSTAATNTATFRGSYNLVSDLHLTTAATRAQIIAELVNVISTADNNDYCFVQIPTADDTPTEIARVDRYKFDGTAWAFEFSLNNSGFTAAQWAAINSAITSGLVTKLIALPTNTELTTLLNGKQDTISDLSTIRSGAAAGATAYQKPSAGIPKTDLTQTVQTSLDKADVAAPQSTTYTKTEVDAAIAVETQRAQGAESTLQGNIEDEETRAKAAELANAGNIEEINEKIPTAASDQNQLADKQFVNNSIATSTANFRGSYNLVNDLHLTTAATRSDIATALASTIATSDSNDYCFVQIPTADETPTEIARVERYKYNGSAWAFEYELNNSGFTSAQWDALNSAITSGLVTKLNALPTNAELTTLLNGKQDTISDLSTIRTGAAAGATAYQKPSAGIPKTDMTSEVQATLQKADAAAPQSTTYSKTEVDGLVGDEETRARAAEQTNADDIDAIEAVIPSAASSSNQLADKAFVNSTIATATATFRGTRNLVSDLSLTIDATQAQVATALAAAISGADNNDYCFVQIPAANDTPSVIARVDRYKFDGTAWAFEFSLNNSGFTAAQWDAINSAITSELVTKLSALPTNAELTTLLAGKQATIDDLSTIRSGAAAGATAYQKPSGGIPVTDLTAELQAQIASFITASVNNLVNYYLKSDTYSRNEVDAIVAAVKQFTYMTVSTLPTASADTMNKIYLVPSADPQTQNVKDEYITISVTENETTTYSWECIGSTAVNLTNYYTKTQTDSAIDAAIDTALASYSTTSEVGTIVSTAITTALNNYSTTTQMENAIAVETTRAQAAEQANATNIAKVTGAEAVTSIPDDWYMMMSNGDGTAFKKALDTYIEQRVVEKIGALITDTDLSTNITKVLGLNSSNALGVNSISTLASVLGVERIANQITAGGTCTISGWTTTSILVIFTTTHGGDVWHAYAGNAALHTGSSLAITFSNGVITSTDSVTQGLRILHIKGY